MSNNDTIQLVRDLIHTLAETADALADLHKADYEAGFAEGETHWALPDADAVLDRARTYLGATEPSPPGNGALVQVQEALETANVHLQNLTEYLEQQMGPFDDRIDEHVEATEKVETALSAARRLVDRGNGSGLALEAYGHLDFVLKAGDVKLATIEINPRHDRWTGHKHPSRYAIRVVWMGFYAKITDGQSMSLDDVAERLAAMGADPTPLLTKAREKGWDADELIQKHRRETTFQWYHVETGDGSWIYLQALDLGEAEAIALAHGHPVKCIQDDVRCLVCGEIIAGKLHEHDNGPVCDDCHSKDDVLGPIYWLECTHPLCVGRWQGSSLETVYDGTLGEYVCPDCGGASAMRVVVEIPKTILVEAQHPLDQWMSGRFANGIIAFTRAGEAGFANRLPADQDACREAHRMIVRTTLAAGHRVPIRVLLDYGAEIARDVIGGNATTFLDEQPRAWKILLRASDIVDGILDRAACGEWPLPETPADFLAWIDDERQIQEDFLADDIHEDERSQRGAYVRRLGEIFRELRDAGITPSRLPWEKG